MGIGILGALGQAERWDTCKVLWEERGPRGFRKLLHQVVYTAYLRKHFPVVQEEAGELASKCEGGR